MERLVRLASALHHAGERGVPAANLLRIAGWEDAADGISALKRDFRGLESLGWQIDNIAERGLHAIYRMRTVDNRLRVQLTPEQQAALRRAVLLANRHDLADRLGLAARDVPADVPATISAGGYDHALATVLQAVRQRALLRFRYKGTDRVVHPESARTQNTTWYLRGRDDQGDGTLKMYVVARMADVRADAPGTADRPEAPHHHGLHPMSWQIDPPVDVTLRAPADYVPDVRRWLGEPATDTDDGDEHELVYRVTHRAALRARVYQLGTRVTVVGPEDVRREILGELAEMAGE